MKIHRILLTTLLTGLIVGLGLGFWTNQAASRSSAIPQELKGQMNPPGKASAIQVPDYPSLKNGNPLTDRTWIELNKIVNPAVVNISTQALMRQRPMPRDPFFDFFQQFMGPNGGHPGGRSRPAQSLGTGFIISEDGLIITNNHVVEGADKINVQITDKAEKTYTAEVVGRDQRSDIALLKIDGGKNKFPVAQLGSSKDVEVGENVAAFGNPFGLGHSMTKGIISAKDRPIDEINRFPFLQTDALINPGNSGGPLVNIKGLVIGVNTAINAAGQGIGFAIPIDEVKSIIVQLQKFGTVKKGFLGVSPQDLSPQAAAYLKLQSLDGALVAQVVPNSPAERAGLKELDVIVEFGSKKIRSSVDLQNAAGDSEIGAKVPVKVVRKGKEFTLNVTVGEFSPERRVAQPTQRTIRPPSQQDKLGFGLKLTNLNSELRAQLGIESDVKGALVSEVEPNSIASFAGLAPGDVIVQVNSEKVASADEAMGKLRRGSNALTVLRSGMVMSIFIGAGE
jgi:serine protease Do